MGSGGRPPGVRAATRRGVNGGCGCVGGRKRSAEAVSVPTDQPPSKPTYSTHTHTTSEERLTYRTSSRQTDRQTHPPLRTKKERPLAPPDDERTNFFPRCFAGVGSNRESPLPLLSITSIAPPLDPTDRATRERCCILYHHDDASSALILAIHTHKTRRTDGIAFPLATRRKMLPTTYYIHIPTYRPDLRHREKRNRRGRHIEVETTAAACPRNHCRRR